MFKNVFLPKKKVYLIIFFSILLVEIFLNVIMSSFVNVNTIVDENSLIFIGTYLLLPIVEVVFCLMFISYLIGCVERLCVALKSSKISRILNFLIICDVVLIYISFFLFLIFGTLINTSSKIHCFISEKIIKNLIVTRIPLNQQDYTVILDYWIIILTMGFLAAAILFMFAIFRKTKLDKNIRLNIQREKQVHIINKALGFNFEDSEFYKQTGLSYVDLSHRNGTKGEFELYKQLVTSELSDMSYVFNREIPKNDGLFTEIDLILIHPKGVFVIENKDYDTDIFGSAVDYDLTIINSAGKKISVYNPIKQNEQHVSMLREYLKTKNFYNDDKIIPIHSIVVFTDIRTNKSDDIIANINMSGTKSKLCTSQNVAYVIKNIIVETSNSVNINTSELKTLLLSLNVREKSIR